MIQERYRLELEKFFQLIADHGRFNAAQLHRYVEMKTGETLDPAARVDCVLYARSKGAVRDPKALAELYQMPIAKKRRRIVDMRSGELFGK